MKNTFEQLQGMFAEALVEASDNYQANLTASENQTAIQDQFGEQHSSQEANLDTEADSAYDGGKKKTEQEDKTNVTREETRETFNRRANEAVRTIRERGETACAYNPVVNQTERAGRTEKELQKLGIQVIVHEGLEANVNGITRVILGDSTSVTGDAVYVRNSIQTDPVETAGHEAYHFWKHSDARSTYTDAIVDNLDFSSDAFIEFQKKIADAYFGEEIGIDDDGSDKLAEEIFAYITGFVHSGDANNIVRPFLRNYDAVKTAWGDLIEKQKGIADTVDQNANNQESTASDIEAPKSKKMTITYNEGNGVVKDFNQAGMKLSKKQRGGLAVAKMLHRLGLGTNFEFFSSYLSKTLKDKDGKPARVFLNDQGAEELAPSGVYMMGDGTIRVDLNAYNGRGLTLNALAHELTHFIQQWSDKKYKILADFLVKTYEGTDMTMHKRVLREQKRLEDIRGEEVSYDEAFDEVVANAMSKMFDDGKLVERLTELKAQDEKLARKLWEGFKKIMSKFLGIYQESPALFDDAGDLVAMKDTFEQLQGMFAEALVEASDNYQASLTVSESQTLAESSKEAGTQQSSQKTDLDKNKNRASSDSPLTRRSVKQRSVGSTHEKMSSTAAAEILGIENIAKQSDSVKKAITVLGEFYVSVDTKKPVLGLKKTISASNLKGSLIAQNILKREGTSGSAYRYDNGHALRISNHSANANNFVGDGEHLSIALFERGKMNDFVDGESNVIEAVFRQRYLDDNPEALKQVIHDIAHFIVYGEYHDTAGAMLYNFSGTEAFKAQAKQRMETDGATRKQQDELYSSQETDLDSDGNKLTEDQAEFFEKSNQETDFDKAFDYSDLNWASDIGIITAKDRAIFERTINNEIFRGAEPQSANGEYIIDTGKCLMFTDGDFHSPTLSRVVVFDTEYESLTADVKEMIYDDAKTSRNLQASLEAIKKMFRPGFLSIQNKPVGYPNGRKVRGRKGSNRSGSNQKVRSIKEMLAAEGKEHLLYSSQETDLDTKSHPYAYDTLVNKPDMKVTTVDLNVPKNRADVVYQAKQNAAKVGKFDPKTGSVSVYVDDINANVLLGTDGLKHGLRRTKDPQNDANYIVTIKAGEIIKNSIKVNEMNPKKVDAKESLVLIGVAKNPGGDTYVVRSIVNRFSNELTSIDALYAINAKKQELAATKSPRFTAEPLSETSSTISIAELLDLVNRYFPDVLPEDVLKHYGYEARPEGDLGAEMLYSEHDTDYTNRDLLANAFETLSQNSEEYKLIQQYKGRIKLLNEYEEKLSKLNTEIREIRFGKGKYDAERLAQLEAKAKEVAKLISKNDKKLLSLEATGLFAACEARQKYKNPGCIYMQPGFAYLYCRKFRLLKSRNACFSGDVPIVTRRQETSQTGLSPMVEALIWKTWFQLLPSIYCSFFTKRISSKRRKSLVGNAFFTMASNSSSASRMLPSSNTLRIIAP